MDQSGQGLSPRDRSRQFIIKTKINPLRELVVLLFTLSVWSYCLSVIYFFLDALLGLNHAYPRLLRIIFKMESQEVRRLTLMGLLGFILIYLFLYGWSYYNKKRYGNLQRRRYPLPASREDLLALGRIDEQIYDVLQDAKFIRFSHNPVRRKKINETET